MKIRFFGVLATLVLSPLSAAPADPLKLLDSRASYKDDFAATYTIEQQKANEGTSVTILQMYRRDLADTFVLKILSPDSDKGKGFIKQGDLIRQYNPERKTFDKTSGKGQLRNSDIRLSDFQGANFSKDYRVVATDRGRLGTVDRTVLTLQAPESADVAFPMVKLWLDDNSLILKRQDFAGQGHLIRTWAIPGYLDLGGRFVPNRIIIADELTKSERTTITITNPSFEKQSDLNIFSDKFLTDLSR